MFLMIDNYDSFTYNIVNYVKKHGRHIDVVTNDVAFSAIDFSKYRGILLSPGPSSPENSGLTLEVLRTVHNIPLFGICLGMQAIGLVFGGKIVHAQKTMHGKIDTISHSGSPIFRDIPEHFDGVRYHSLAVAKDGLPSQLRITATASDGEVMALEHTQLPVYGVQYHPESYLSQYGMETIKNFIEVCDEYQKSA